MKQRLKWLFPAL
ncbi:class II aldolase, tagatose bisphosphate family, partial [Yersinia pestis PY-53]